MHEFKLVGTPLGHDTNFSITQAPSTEKGRREIKTTPYANGVGSIMYKIVCIRPDLTHVPGLWQILDILIGRL